jgi:hypothetical protein
MGAPDMRQRAFIIGNEPHRVAVRLLVDDNDFTGHMKIDRDCQR